MVFAENRRMSAPLGSKNPTLPSAKREASGPMAILLRDPALLGKRRDIDDLSMHRRGRLNEAACGANPASVNPGVVHRWRWWVDAMSGMVTQVRPPRQDGMDACYRALLRCDPGMV
ncbi:hypothetical protein WME89_41510 [Sorangium sp. So ce321]|uniref:hypothetical protein n=1 Tax=Sorangium sp. So ce321 TaxID=3133300 RepID=UPI003F62EF00